MRDIGLDQIDGTAHRRISLASQRLTRMIGHLDDVGREQAGHVGGECTPELALQVGLPPDQSEANVAEFMGGRHRRRHGNRGTAVAAHGVDGNMEQRRHGASEKPGRRANRRRRVEAYSSAAAASALV